MHYYTFCAANSSIGFVSFFENILDENSNNVYYLKGGPGCGKSTLLKQIAEKAPSAELIRCSADPESLDGVIIKEKNAVIIDATNPHSHEPTYPGICGNIVDLGEAWDTEKLNKDLIINMSKEKKELYQNCYNILKAARKIHECLILPAKQTMDRRRIDDLTQKLLRQNALTLPTKKCAAADSRYLSAISPTGLITLNETFLQLGKNVIILEDRWMLADLFLQNVHEKLNNLKIYHICGFHPLYGPEALQHIIIPEANLSIVSKDGLFNTEIPEENIVKTISIQKYISKNYLDEHKNKMSFYKKVVRDLMNSAVDKLKQARDVHLKIEQEYSLGTDHNATSHLKKKLMDKLFSQT